MTDQEAQIHFKKIYSQLSGKPYSFRRGRLPYTQFAELFGQWGDFIEEYSDDKELLAGLRYAAATESTPYHDNAQYWWCTRSEHNDSSNYFSKDELFGSEGFHDADSLVGVMRLLGREVIKNGLQQG